jgi:hypothetical protein
MRLTDEVGINCTDDDTGVVRGPTLMEFEEVTAVIGQESAALGGRKGKTSASEMAAFALPASIEVRTSWPRWRNSITTPSGIFSFV